jgi:FkbM family methyltransferase
LSGIRIAPAVGLSDGKMPFGAHCGFEFQASEPGTEYRLFLRHGQVLHAKPLREWSAEPAIYLFPEAPGPYALLVEWRAPSGAGGFEEAVFEVEPSFPGPIFQPTLAKNGEVGEWWVPNQHEANGVVNYEMGMLGGLEALVEPGAVVYDIGANVGLAAVPLAKAVGPTGLVVCFEPNPLCVAYLQANLERHGCTQCRILPFAITGGEQKVAFTVNFANSLLGLSRSSFFYEQKIGQEIEVAGDSLENLRHRYRLPPPQAVKIDVEGAEVAIFEGLRGVLEQHRPLVLFEIHHPQVAVLLLPILSGWGYSYQDTGSGKRYETAESLIAEYSEGIRQVICFPPGAAGAASPLVQP